MKNNQDQSVRDHLLYLLEGGGAHARFDEVIAEFPTMLRGMKVA